MFDRLSDVSDQELDSIIQAYKATHPNDGETIVTGHLRSLQINVPRRRIRESIHRVDPSGTEERARSTVRRRAYHVDAPNEVWHMDGNHKLIRWKFVIHGAVDGYSGLIVFLRCSTNNRAETVLQGFLPAILTYGLPQKLRTDMGGENTAAWRYMIQRHGHENCVIAGSSVHNERIERLWRDVHRAVLTPFKELFMRLEREGICDVNNDIDLFCLHEVFQSRINKCLSEFTSSWNNHSLSTEHNMSPLQLYSVGRAGAEFSSDSEDEIGQPSIGHGTIVGLATEPVEVSNLHFQPCTPMKSEIGRVSQLPSESNGYDLFRQATLLLGQHLQRNCNACVYD